MYNFIKFNCHRIADLQGMGEFLPLVIQDSEKPCPFRENYNQFTRRRASKAFYRNPKTTFLVYFHVFAGNHQWTYH